MIPHLSTRGTGSRLHYGFKSWFISQRNIVQRTGHEMGNLQSMCFLNTYWWWVSYLSTFLSVCSVDFSRTAWCHHFTQTLVVKEDVWFYLNHQLTRHCIINVLFKRSSCYILELVHELYCGSFWLKAGECLKTWFICQFVINCVMFHARTMYQGSMKSAWTLQLWLYCFVISFH